jgi:hypothetical protein
MRALASERGGVLWLTGRTRGQRGLAVYALVAISSCNSRMPISGIADAASNDTGSGADGGASGPCPAQAPVAGTSCSRMDLVCEYGDDPNAFCRTYARCDQARWRLDAVSTTECPSMKATSCPASFSAARDVACSESGRWCVWDSGTPCKCTDCRPGPIAPICTGSATWHCEQTTTDCPAAMPRSGSVCTGDPVLCEYGCEFGARRCTAGVWTAEPGLCPISTRAAKEDIHYLSPAEIDRLATETEAIRVASYRYRSAAAGGSGTHLGFIIEDSPRVPAVSATHKTVDLYGFASMLLAASQAQARKIETLEREMAHLRKQRRCTNETGSRSSDGIHWRRRASP